MLYFKRWNDTKKLLSIQRNIFFSFLFFYFFFFTFPLNHYLQSLLHLSFENSDNYLFPNKTLLNLYTSTSILFYSILFYPITLEGRWGTTDEFATIPFLLVLFSAALVEPAKSIPIHSLILSSHLFFRLPLLFPFTVPCRIVLAKPEDLETWPNHLSFHFLTRVRSSLYSPMAAWIFLRISSLVTWSLYGIFNSLQ